MSYPLPMRHPTLLALLLAACLASSGSPACAQAPAPARYVAGLEDVPLMAGLTPAGGNDVAFDSPQGRIVIVNAAGAVERQAVEAFYAASLGELGWDRIGDTAFRREGELLRLEFGQRGSDLTVRFALSPVH
jgi:hypothetical protein